MMWIQVGCLKWLELLNKQSINSYQFCIYTTFIYKFKYTVSGNCASGDVCPYHGGETYLCPCLYLYPYHDGEIYLYPCLSCLFS